MTWFRFPPGRRAALPLLLILPLLPLLPLACGRPPSGQRRFELEKTYGQGRSVSFAVRVSRLKITTAEQVTLELESRADEAWRVAFPEIAGDLGQFQVSQREAERRNLGRDGTLTVTRAYTLEPSLPGSYQIPPLTLSFGEAGEEFPFSLTSEPIAVEVSSVLPPTLGEQDLEEIAGPVDLPSRRWLWIGGGAAAAVVLAAGALLLLRRRRAGLPAGRRPLGSGEAALAELDQLLARGLAEQGLYREFYQGLSDLARRYVERRYAIRAPERTTEEFLREAQDSPALSGHSDLLRSFLLHCDLVKFARLEPRPAEVTAAVEACRSFITRSSNPEAGP
jgi:hypothetical protein